MEWKLEHDTMLLQEIIISEPYLYKPFTRERGHVWEQIADRLNASPAFANRLKQKRSVRDRYSLLAKKFTKKMADEEKASGISPEFTDLEKLLEEIIEKFNEGDSTTGKNEKKEQDKAKAEEMRKRSMEKLSETMKRTADEEGECASAASTPKKRRASGNETMVYLKEKGEREFEIRKEELELKKTEHGRQQKIYEDTQKQQMLMLQQQTQLFQYMQQQQQQQQQQLQHQQQMMQTKLLMSLIEKLNNDP